MKRLFAVSSNCCAFPDCERPLIDEAGTVVGEIAHICAQNDGGPRWNAGQSAEERHGFDNLILLCPSHHKRIDENEDLFQVGHLLEMKANHERRSTKPLPLTDDDSDQFIDNYAEQQVNIGPVTLTGGQLIGIQNNYGELGATSVVEDGWTRVEALMGGLPNVADGQGFPEHAGRKYVVLGPRDPQEIRLSSLIPLVRESHVLTDGWGGWGFPIKGDDPDPQRKGAAIWRIWGSEREMQFWQFQTSGHLLSAASMEEDSPVEQGAVLWLRHALIDIAQPLRFANHLRRQLGSDWSVSFRWTRMEGRRLEPQNSLSTLRHMNLTCHVQDFTARVIIKDDDLHSACSDLLEQFAWAFSLNSGLQRHISERLSCLLSGELPQ